MKDRLPSRIAIFVLCLAVLALYTGGFPPPEHAVDRDEAFPSRIGDYTAQEVRYDRAVIGVLAADHVVYKRFHKRGGVPITLFVALYEGLEKTDFSHSPVVCFTGQGWKIDGETKVDVAVGPENRHRIRVNQLIQTRMGTRMVTLFWYQSRRGVTDNRGVLKLTLFYDSLFGRSVRNAFVRLTAVVPEKTSVEKTAASMEAFVREVYPSLRLYILGGSGREASF